MNTSELKYFIKSNLGKVEFNDKVFLSELLSVLIRLFNIEEYLNNIIITDLSNYEAVGLYKKKLKVILLDLKNSLNYIEHLERKYKSVVNSDMIEYYYYLNILHEAVHAYQMKYISNKNNTLHSKLLLDSMSVGNGDIKLNGKGSILSHNKATKLYDTYHPYFPIEREAITLSNIILKDIFISISPSMSPIIKREYLNDVFMGYIKDNELTSPTKEFYSIIKRNDIFDTFDYSEYDYMKRITLGLPITTEEFYNHVLENNESINNKVMSIRVLKNEVRFY